MGLISPERDLWQSVLHAAWVDAQRGDAACARWLLRCGSDMRQVCGLAGLDPEIVSEEARRQGLEEARRRGLSCGKPLERPEAFQEPLSAGLLQRLAGLRDRVGGHANAS